MRVINILVASGITIYLNRSASSSCVWTSKSEPLAIERNLAYSDFESRPFPSAIFDGIDTTARRNWSQRAKRSSTGKDRIKS